MAAALERAEFDLLAALATPQDDARVARMIGETVFDATTRAATLAALTARGFAADGQVTAAGYAALEPYRVRRLILPAAGVGSRLLPLTRTTPKPLVRVGGVRLIDTLIDAAQAVGIEEIAVVRGHLGEQFEALREKYPHVELIDNPLYNSANNIASVLAAGDRLQNAYICDADLFLHTPAVFKKYHWRSNYCGKYAAHTSGSCFTVRDGVIASHGFGGEDCFEQIGIAYLNAADGARAAAHLRQVWQRPDGKGYFWDKALFAFFGQDYRIEVRACAPGDVTEIDTYEELCALDPTYLL